MIKILIADDHAVVRSGLSMLLSAKPQFKVVGEAAEGGEAIQKAEELKPDVILMDLSMPHGKMVYLLHRKLRRNSPTSLFLF